MATQQQTSSGSSQIRSAVSPLPITLGGIPMGSTGPGQPSVQFLVLRPPTVQIGTANRGLPSLSRVSPTEGLSTRYITIAPARPGTPGNKVSISPLQNGQNQASSSSSPGTPKFFLVSSTVDELQEKSQLDFKTPSGCSVLMSHEENAASNGSESALKDVPKRGRKRMTDLEKAEAKKEREEMKSKGGDGEVKKKRQRRRVKKNQGNPVNDFTAELNELRQKIQGRFEKHKKPNVKKEEVGYFGPYIQTYQQNCPTGDVPMSSLGSLTGGVPVPNFIVDTFEAHLELPDAKKSRYKLDKQMGVALEGPFVCFFCHLDPSAERETAMGDLIGPILCPSSRTVSNQTKRRDDEEKKGFYSHEKCLEWSSNFRMIGYEIIELENLLEDAKTACAVCKRRGATIGCSAPVRCQKSFHYPCAKLSGCKLVPGSHQVYCNEHKDVTVKKHGYEKEIIMAETEMLLRTETIG